MSTNNDKPDKQDGGRIAISVSVNVQAKKIVVTYDKAVVQIQFTGEQATKHIEALRTGLKALEAIGGDNA